MTDSKARRIVADIHNRIRDDLVTACDKADALRCDGTGKSYGQIEELQKLLHKIDCEMTKIFDGSCQCDSCNRPEPEPKPAWWMRRIGAVHS